jgi:RNA polymerase sigma factor (sigma-70 family)
MNIPPRFNNIKDLDLWRLFLQGDEEAFAHIFETSARPLYRYGHALTPHKEIVEDSIQDIFIELWNSRLRLKDTDNILYYLFKVLRRKIFKNIDSNILLDDDLLKNNSDSIPSLETTIIENENQVQKLAHITDAISKLSPRQREVLELRFYQGFSYEEIGVITEINLQSVHNTVHRALTALRQIIPYDLFNLVFLGSALIGINS